MYRRGRYGKVFNIYFDNLSEYPKNKIAIDSIVDEIYNKITKTIKLQIGA